MVNGDRPVSRNPGDRPVLGISIGDPAGIGPEIALKALARSEIYEKAVPVVYADRLVLEDALEVTGKELALHPVKGPGEALGRSGTVDFIEAGVISRRGDYAYGKIGAKSGDAAFQYVVKALKDAQMGAIDAVVTCPINKEAINLAGHHFAGHTEIFAHYTDTKNYGMLLSAKSGERNLNVIHVTTHVSLRRACDLITKDRVLDTIRLANLALTLMGAKTRRIAVAGLNPHGSENGLFGDEEAVAIIPAILAAKAEGLDASGPYPPDTVFVKALGGAFDIVVAMYHDQGHIPLKLCGFTINKKVTRRVPVTFSGVNTTIGLPVIRTSVDHGTAFDIAGKNQSSEDSLLDAIDMAITFCVNRRHSC
jgi:4-hydroxythreonine-4-phosphate dehydrogenase